MAGMKEDGQESYYLQDELGSPIRLANQNGELQDSYGYDEFGQDLYGNQGITQPFGYTGYQPDRIAGTYYAQAREYRPELGRFVAVDIIKGFTTAPYTLNEYGYCWNNPKKFVDLNGRLPWRTINDLIRRGKSSEIWSFKNDKQGREILWHYLYGKGKELVHVDGEWGEYMKDNELLKQKVADIVFEYSENLETGGVKEIDITTSMVIQNGEDIIGYQYLHGTNEEVGGFHIVGNISKDIYGNITYDLTYTWNDKIDPDYSYNSDSIKAKVAKLIPFARPTDYVMRITFSDKTVISSSGSSGWLADMVVNTECIDEGEKKNVR